MEHGQVTTERNWNPARDAGTTAGCIYIYMGSMRGLDVRPVRARFGFLARSIVS